MSERCLSRTWPQSHYELFREDLRPEDLRPEDLRPEDLRPEDLRPEDFRDDFREDDFFDVDFRADDFFDVDFRDDDFRDPPELFFDDDFLEDFVRPSPERCLFTVAAAICFALRVDLPFFFALALMCSYCRSSLSLQASGISSSFRSEACSLLA